MCFMSVDEEKTLNEIRNFLPKFMANSYRLIAVCSVYIWFDSFSLIKLSCSEGC